jgi:hypothetical protein
VLVKPGSQGADGIANRQPTYTTATYKELCTEREFRRQDHRSLAWLALRPRGGQGATTIRASTLVTSDADHATRSASWRSSQVRTVPLRNTSLPLVSDKDAVGFCLSVALERFLSFLPDLGRLSAGLDGDDV